MTQTKLFYLLSLVIHLALIILGIYQDKNFVVKYSDIDYDVFTDAAARIVDGGSPYERHTYRYTPLLAYLMIPNVIWFKAFGKFLFAAGNILCTILLENMLDADNKILSFLWLFNPFAIQIATRGNADVLSNILVLGTLHALKKNKTALAGFLFGIVVHYRIYPIIFGIPFLLSINKKYLVCQDHLFESCQSGNRRVFELTRSQWRFVTFSSMTFCLLGALFYFLNGWDFLYESYLYHVIRADHRHNLSPSFYMLYLRHLIPANRKLLGLLLLIPQWLGSLFIGIKFARQDIAVACFLQTLCFVCFNKVCTAQYFLWWMVLLPLACMSASNRYAEKRLFYKRLAILCIFWLITNAVWMHGGYMLEFQGKSAFLWIWISGLLFHFANVTLMLFFIASLKSKLKV